MNLSNVHILWFWGLGTELCSLYVQFSTYLTIKRHMESDKEMSHRLVCVYIYNIHLTLNSIHINIRPETISLVVD